MLQTTGAGASRKHDYVTGTNTDQMLLLTFLPALHTICSVTRYADSATNKHAVLAAPTYGYDIGHGGGVAGGALASASGLAGVVDSNGYVRGDTSADFAGATTDWVSVCTVSQSCRVWIDGINRCPAAGTQSAYQASLPADIRGGYGDWGQLGINMYGNAANDSDWAVAEVVVFDRVRAADNICDVHIDGESSAMAGRTLGSSTAPNFTCFDCVGRRSFRRLSSQRCRFVQALFSTLRTTAPVVHVLERCNCVSDLIISQ